MTWQFRWHHPTDKYGHARTTQWFDYNPPVPFYPSPGSILEWREPAPEFTPGYYRTVTDTPGPHTIYWINSEEELLRFWPRHSTNKYERVEVA